MSNRFVDDAQKGTRERPEEIETRVAVLESKQRL